MPSTGPITDSSCQITTNIDVINNPSHEFILSGQYYKDGGNKNGGNQIAFKVPANNHAVIVSQSIKEVYLSGLSQASVNYLSRDEVQGDIVTTEKLGDEFRILRIMPLLIIKQGGKEYLNLTFRGVGASDTGHWGCASSLVSGPVTARSIYQTLNRETGLLVDGNIATFAPSSSGLGDFADIFVDSREIKRSLAGKSPELKRAFANKASFLEISTAESLPAKADTVSFYGALDGDLNCVVADNEYQRTLTLIFPLVATVPEGAVLTAFNGQGYNGPAALVEKDFLKKEGARNSKTRGAIGGIQLIPGLDDFVFGS